MSDNVTLPKQKKPIGYKWIYHIKYKSTSEIDRFKAILIAKVYSQKKGIDYQEIFSLVVMIETVRIVLAIVAQKNWHVHQMNVLNAFL